MVLFGTLIVIVNTFILYLCLTMTTFTTFLDFIFFKLPKLIFYRISLEIKF